MSDTSQQFLLTPNGARFIAETAGFVRVEAETFDGRQNAALAAIEYLILEYDTEASGKDLDSNNRFYEQIFVLLAGHMTIGADWPIQPSQTIADAIRDMVSDIESNGGLKTTLGDLLADVEEED